MSCIYFPVSPVQFLLVVCTDDGHVRYSCGVEEPLTAFVGFFVCRILLPFRSNLNSPILAEYLLLVLILTFQSYMRDSFNQLLWSFKFSFWCLFPIQIACTYSLVSSALRMNISYLSCLLIPISTLISCNANIIIFYNRFSHLFCLISL